MNRRFLPREERMRQHRIRCKKYSQNRKAMNKIEEDRLKAKEGRLDSLLKELEKNGGLDSGKYQELMGLLIRFYKGTLEIGRKHGIID